MADLGDLSTLRTAIDDRLPNNTGQEISPTDVRSSVRDSVDTINGLFAPLRITQTDAENDVDGSGTLLLAAGKFIQITDNGRVYIADGIRTIAVLVAQRNYLVPNGGKREYRATLAQSGTGAPAATIHESSYGASIVWSRGAPGSYSATLAGAFVSGKVWCMVSIKSNQVGDEYIASLSRFSDDVISLRVFDLTGAEIDEFFADVQIITYP